MKLLLFVFLAYFSSGQSAFVLEKIDGVEGDVSGIEFDTNGNVYVSTKNETNYFLHKLNPATEKIWTIETPAEVTQIITNSENVVYLKIFVLLSNILREDTLTIEEIYNHWLIEPIFIDEADNLYFNTQDGVVLLRPNSTTPILIKNLEEGFNLYEEHSVAIDGEGNVIFPVIGAPPPSNVSVAILTKEAKEEDVPYAKIFPLEGEPLVEYLVADEEGSAWVFTYKSASCTFYKISNDTVENVLHEGVSYYKTMKAVGDRVYVLRTLIWEDASSVFYFTLDGKVNVVPELENVDNDVLGLTKIEADKEGNVYLGSWYSFDKGEIVIVKPDEGKNIWIDFSEKVNVYAMVLDENNDLWVNTYKQGVYYVKKGDNVPVKVHLQSGNEEDLIRGIMVNRKRNDVFVKRTNGLYVVVDNL